jgi:putative methyltransferase (TIGR04325 family)
MINFTNNLRLFLLLSIGLLNKLHLLLTAPLTYSPKGWDTDIPVGKNSGWDCNGVSLAEDKKWSVFCHAVSQTGPLGFSHEHTDLTITDNLSFHNVNISFGYVLACAARQKADLSILDYGGGLGHYYQLGKALLPDLHLHYSCKDYPRLAEVGKKLNPDIHWFTDDTCLKNVYDLVIISGSLQYIRQWQKFLRDAASATGDYLFLTRVPVVKKAFSFIAVQEAYGTRMLHQQFNRAELLHAIDDAGFTIIREFLAGDCPYIKNAPEQCDLRGWLLQKRAVFSKTTL